MPGWQITLIAVGTALVTAIAAVFLDRVLAVRLLNHRMTNRLSLRRTGP
jgi:hypothetical protein